jgi:predicted solute-binding protein
LIRIGCSPHLNARPLTEGLDGESGVELTVASPARLADLLRAGWLHAALTSSSECFGADYCIIPGAAISSASAAADAVLFSRVPLTHLRRVALNAASRSTNLLLRLVLHWLRPGAAITYEIRPEDTCRSLADCDACLLIGDGAIVDTDVAEYRYDLARLWWEHTGLPMVLSLWLARPGVDKRVVRLLNSARERGLSRLHALAEEYANARGWDRTLVTSYLTEAMDYSWTPRHEESLLRFGAELHALGLVPGRRDLCYLSENSESSQAPVESSQAT